MPRTYAALSWHGAKEKLHASMTTARSPRDRHDRARLWLGHKLFDFSNGLVLGAGEA
jgi:hypothetical protein